MLIPCLFALLLLQADSPIEIRSSGLPGHVEFVVPADASLPLFGATGTVGTRRGESLLRVSLQTKTQQSGPPIFGSYRYSNGKLQFTPRFRLIPGETYRATFTPRPNMEFRRLYRVPLNYTRPPPVVTAVYPSASRLSENHLKFYIHFSQPMREGRDIFSQIVLLDSAGKPVRGAWRRTELWNHNATRFTLWIHPGRIKQGVNLRDQEGPVLVAGQKYSLNIPTTLRGADGQHLSRTHVKVFQTAVADHQRPNPLRWQLTTPTVASRHPLEVNFHEPLDRALSLRCIQVRDDIGALVPGTTTLVADESQWRFVPRSPWKNARYQLSVSGTLEDLAGNTPDRVFDTDLAATRPSAVVKEISFQPHP